MRLPMLLLVAVLFVACDCGSAGGGGPCTTDEECLLDERCTLQGVCEPLQCEGDAEPCTGVCCEPGRCGAGGCEAAACTDDQTSCGGGTDCCETSETCFFDACCPRDAMCGNVCCPAGQLCEAGICRTRCADGRPACGPSATCCTGSESCHLGACVTPGDVCQPSPCPGRDVVGGCRDDEVCDPTLGRCVPRRSDPGCVYVPPQGVFDPVPRFTWGQRRARPCLTDGECQKEETCAGGQCTVGWSHVTPGGGDLPDYYQVTSIPMVADLDADCVPEVIFNTYRDSVITSDGVLRAIRGDDGSRVWTVTDPALRTDSTANPALADLEGDGRIETVVLAEGRATLLCFDDGGGLKWRSDPFGFTANSGSAAFANMDNEGHAEVLFGSAIFDSSGALLFAGTEGTGRPGQGPISCAADLDGDGRPELIAGRTVYQTTGTVAGGDFAGSVRWNDATLPDGYCGVADFDLNGAPEVVHIAGGTLTVLDGQTWTRLASFAIPGGGNGGAPNIADFDGDGTPDIGTAGGANYVVVAFDGVDTLSLIWSAPTEDDSSQRTGSSVFDFDGDGRNEVVYNDEEYIRIYPGVEPDCLSTPAGPGCDGVMTDAEVLFRDLNSSRTRTEYPVIADVDGDFKAEIVFPTSNEASFLDPALLGDAGIEVWEDRLDNWVPTRPIWNQHTYHVTNVDERGVVPASEPPNWSTPPTRPYNSYRRNTQGEVDFCAPDLVLQGLSWNPGACSDLEAQVWVVNEGCLGVGAGVDVAFFDGGALLGVVQTVGPLTAGSAEQVTLTVTAPEPSWSFVLTASVDDDGSGAGRLNECREDNNAAGPVEGGCLAFE